ncbi:hypothetical protein An08g09270 [Aspergillus niger]|uniref:Uncharacterized protein n=2 Tax=Aspergillus niger TaxID=5061 RepID=A5AB72_ASPNC|nr:hypothetical protein An08g09270 [Aspergillus niger]CAK96706.1 hypothetical protein An08g09270 [Aspergillus niger]
MRDLPLDAGRNYKGPICGIHAVQGYIIEFVVAVTGRCNELTALNQVQIRVRPAGLNECAGDEICRLVRTQDDDLEHGLTGLVKYGVYSENWRLSDSLTIFLDADKVVRTILKLFIPVASQDPGSLTCKVQIPSKESLLRSAIVTNGPAAMAFASSFTGTALGKAAAREPYKRDGVYRTFIVRRLPASYRSKSSSLAASKAPPCEDPSAHHTRSSWARIRAGVILASAASWTGTSAMMSSADINSRVLVGPILIPGGVFISVSRHSAIVPTSLDRSRSFIARIKMRDKSGRP